MMMASAIGSDSGNVRHARGWQQAEISGRFGASRWHSMRQGMADSHAGKTAMG